jgi:hypothetical protein
VLLSAADSQPIPYGTIIGPDSSGRFANATGQFSLGDVKDGTYHIRARMLGYSPLDTTITFGPTRSPLLVLRLAPAAIRLSTVPVTAQHDRHGACVVTGIPGRGVNPQLAAIFEQLDANIERYNILLEKYPFRYRRQETELILTDGMPDSTVYVDTATYDSRERRPYHVGSIVYNDVTISGHQRIMMYLPNFADLRDTAFDAAHCFAYMGQENNEIRIDFRPADRIKVSDVNGSVYLDAATYLVRRAVFHLTKPKLTSSTIFGLTVTTTFQEVMPLVPIVTALSSEQPLMAIRTRGVDPRTTGRAPTVYDLHPLLSRIAVENDVVLDHTFIADDTANARVALQPPKPITITLGCDLPPSFETIDIPIYGTVTGARAGDPNNDRVTLGIRRQFHLPNNVDLPVYGFEFNSKVAPTVTGQVTFELSRGRVTSVALTATSLVPTVDSALVTAVRRADSLKAFVGVPAGMYTMSLSSAKPDGDALAIDLAHISVGVLPLAHKAAIDFNAPPPLLPSGNGTFQFVVDEHGQAIPTTMVTVKTSSPIFARAVGKALDKLRFDPAVSGNCPIKQVVQQPFRAQFRIQD